MYVLTSKSAVGTHYLSEIICSYEQLVKVLGEHNNEGDGYKVTTEWVVEGPDGAILTVYDWKATHAYDSSDESLTLKQLRSGMDVYWHIGGSSLAAAEKLHQYITAKIKEG